MIEGAVAGIIRKNENGTESEIRTRASALPEISPEMYRYPEYTTVTYPGHDLLVQTRVRDGGPYGVVGECGCSDGADDGLGVVSFGSGDSVHEVIGQWEDHVEVEGVRS